jgi:hypothetical protein
MPHILSVLPAPLEVIGTQNGEAMPNERYHQQSDFDITESEPASRFNAKRCEERSSGRQEHQDDFLDDIQNNKNFSRSSTPESSTITSDFTLVSSPSENHFTNFQNMSASHLEEVFTDIFPSPAASVSEVRAQLTIWYEMHQLTPNDVAIKKVYWTGRQVYELGFMRMHFDLSAWGFGAYSWGIIEDFWRARKVAMYGVEGKWAQERRGKKGMAAAASDGVSSDREMSADTRFFSRYKKFEGARTSENEREELITRLAYWFRNLVFFILTLLADFDIWSTS